MGLLLLAAHAEPPGTPGELPDYFIQSWQTEDGLPQNSVNAVIQTRNGYLWLATFNGLVRFDGVRFTIFDSSNTPELENSRITSLFQDSRGRLWIGHETGHVSRYDNAGFHSEAVVRGGIRGSVLSFGEDEQGEIWMINVNGRLVRLRDDFTFQPPLDVAIAASVLSLVQDSDGSLWALRCGSLGRIRDGKCDVVGLDPQTNIFVKAICPARGGGLWVMVDRYLRRWAKGQWSGETRPCSVTLRIVTALAELRSGTLAIGTEGEGLYVLPPSGDLRHYAHTNGLSQDWVRSLWEDREGNLWVGTGNGGLDVLRLGNVSEIAPPDRWQGRAVLSVCNSLDGGLWVGTEGAGLYHFLNGAWEHLGGEAGLPNLFIWSVLEDTAGRLWVGTWGGGLLVRTGQRFETPKALANFAAPVTALYEDAQGGLWAGTGEGLLHIKDSEVTQYNEHNGFQLPDVRTILQDSQGALWAGMSGGGLARLANGALRQFHKRDGLFSDFIQCLHLEPDGTLWIGTFGGGLVRWKDQHFSGVTTKQGLPNNVICSLEEDGHGHFWISSHGGIFRVSIEELNQCAERHVSSVNCLVYGKSEGLPTAECSGGFEPVVGRTSNGRLWFPTRKGLVGALIGTIHTNPVAPPVILEEVLVDGAPVSIPSGKEPLRMKPGQDRLEFHYTGLCYTAPERVQFKYRLDRLESDWVNAGTRRSAAYSYLPPGEYAFHVIACNNDGVWSASGASLDLVVLPHFWQTWLFRLFGGILTAASAGGLALFETRRRMHRKLERLERQQAIERERSRIARDIHDDLGASLTQITMLSQSASNKAERAEQMAADMGQIYHTARDLTRAMDEIVWAVNPHHDSLDSLAAYLGKFSQDFFRPFDIACRLDIPLQLPHLPLTAESRHNLFLAFKEALNNVAKHSGATEVRISLAPGQRQFELAVQDNGRGFVFRPGRDGVEPGADGSPSGNGIANMFSRMARIAGRCEVVSEPGKGTTIKFAAFSSKPL